MILHQHVSSIPIPFGSGLWFIGTYRQSFPTPRNTTPYTFTHPNWPKRTHTHITHTLNLGVHHQMQWTYEEVCVSCVFSISRRKSTLVLVVEIITLFIGTYTKYSRSLSCTYLTFHRIKEQPYIHVFLRLKCNDHHRLVKVAFVLIVVWSNGLSHVSNGLIEYIIR